MTSKLLINGRVYDTVGWLMRSAVEPNSGCLTVRTRHLKVGGSGWIFEPRAGYRRRPHTAVYFPITLDIPYREGGVDDEHRYAFLWHRACRFWPATFPPESDRFRVTCPEDWWAALCNTPFDTVMLGALADYLDERDRPRLARAVRRVVAAL